VSLDAALEANVGRFADVVKEFARRSQFIITHNKAAMAAADTLCGVTMGDPGVSKILSVRLED
jgi:chromosome segregation protein